MRDKSFLAMVVDIVQELKQQNSQLVYGRCWAVTRWGGVTWGPVHARSASPLLGILTSRSTSQPVSAESSGLQRTVSLQNSGARNTFTTNLASVRGEQTANKLCQCWLQIPATSHCCLGAVGWTPRVAR